MPRCSTRSLGPAARGAAIRVAGPWPLRRPGSLSSLLLSTLLLTACPDAPAMAPPSLAGTAPTTSASPTEGDPAYVPPPNAGGPTDWTPGLPFPMPDPLPPEAAPHVAQDGPRARPGSGAVELWLGGRGEEDGRFTYPRAMTTTADGALYVADKSGRIQKFSPEGEVLRVVRTPGITQGKPTGLGIDRHGDLLVADTHYCRVLVYDPDLKLKRWFGAPGREPGRFMMITSVHAADGGLLYASDFGDDVARVQVFQEDGTYLRSFGEFGWGAAQLRRPMNLAIDEGRDRVYVCDAANHRISVFTRAGQLLRHFGGEGQERGQLGYPYDVKLDEQGRLWVAEFGNQRLSVFDPEGQCLGAWGAPGRAVGGLNRPWAVALGPAQRVWVLDSNGDRCYALTRTAVLGS
ncbi:MAG: hypothetical protein AB7N76_27595 [Planctomycetota bacterium]